MPGFEGVAAPPQPDQLYPSLEPQTGPTPVEADNGLPVTHDTGKSSTLPLLSANLHFQDLIVKLLSRFKNYLLHFSGVNISIPSNSGFYDEQYFCINMT